jgi:hypothetical protein
MLMGKGSIIGSDSPERASVVSARAVGTSVVFLFNREVKVREKTVADDSLSFDLQEYNNVVQDGLNAVRVDFDKPVINDLTYTISEQPNWCETPLQTPAKGTVV